MDFADLTLCFVPRLGLSCRYSLQDFPCSPTATITFFDIPTKGRRDGKRGPSSPNFPLLPPPKLPIKGGEQEILFFARRSHLRSVIDTHVRFTSDGCFPREERKV